MHLLLFFPATNSFVKQPSYFFMGHFSKVIPPDSVRVGMSLSAQQKCRYALAATNQQICDGITWACNNQRCAPGTNSCAPDVIHANADAVFDQWYQTHTGDGPAACDFSGAAVLEGIQAVTFLRPDKQVVVVVLNVGDRETQYTISYNQQLGVTTVPGHSIQSLVWDA